MKGFFNKLNYKISVFMNGRYGADDLFRFLMIAELILIVLNAFARSRFIDLIELLILIYAIFRLVSRNSTARRKENEKYLSISKKARDAFSLGKDKFRDRKTHVYKKCPKCGAVLRFPKTAGEHTVRCPKCSERFDVKIR